MMASDPELSRGVGARKGRVRIPGRCAPPSGRFNPFSIPFSKRHSYLRKARVQKGGAPATCKVRACKYLRGHVHTFQPFIDLLTRRHSSVLSLLLSSHPLLLYLSFYRRRCRVAIEGANRADRDGPVFHEFRNVARHKAGRTLDF